jgi:hypothetical protein
VKILTIKRRNSRPAEVSIRSDNLLFLSIALAPFLTPAGSTTRMSSGEAMVSTVSVGAVSLALGWSVVAAFSRWRLWRMRARPLPRETCPAIWRIIRSESKKMAMKAPQRVFWIPGLHRGAAWVLGGFRRKLILTGGLCVSAERSPQIAEMIIRHELAHLDNKDTRAAAILTWIGLFGLNLFFYPVPDVAVGATVIVIISIFLLQRREYLADAHAINGSPDTDGYLRLIVAQSWRHGGWFHPTADERANALLRDSPVLRANAMMLVLASLLALGGWGAVQQIFRAPDRYQLGGLLILRLCIFAVPVLAFCSELAKGFGRKIPTPLEPLGTALDHPSGQTFEREQGLATLIGSGDRVDWARFILFLAATLALQMSWRIAFQGFHGRFPSAENLWFSFVEGWCWWWLPSAFFVFVLFRYSRDASEVAVGVAIAMAFLLSLRPAPYKRDLLNGTAQIFATTWFTYASLAWAARVRRFAWFALAAAIFAGGVGNIVLENAASRSSETRSISLDEVGAFAIQSMAFVLVLYGGRLLLANRRRLK